MGILRALNLFREWSSELCTGFACTGFCLDARRQTGLNLNVDSDKEGFCSFCGKIGACCRRGVGDSYGGRAPGACTAKAGGIFRHTCVEAADTVQALWFNSGSSSRASQGMAGFPKPTDQST